MPRPYIQKNERSDDQVIWKKLADLKSGSTYRVRKTLQKMKSYNGSAEKLVVYLELEDSDGGVFMISGNTKLKYMLEDSHVENINQGWRLLIGDSTSGDNGYLIVDVDLMHGDANPDTSDDDDNIPF